MASEETDWRQSAIDFQQEICENFSDVTWDVYQEEEVLILKDKVKVILYGPSTDPRNGDAEALVDKISEVIIKEGTCELEGVSSRKAIYMVFIFIIGTDDGHHIGSWPVFKVPKNSTGIDACFIDLNCRVYENWKDFLDNNMLPAREYCYPKNGNYYFVNGRAAVEFGKAPQAKIVKKIVKAMDVASTGIAVGSTFLAAASLCVPVMGPLLAASVYAAGGVSAYSAVRSTNTLYDRKVHKQSIGLKDAEARGCYLSIAGGVVGFGATAATSATIKAAQSGRDFGLLTTRTVTALNGSALVLNGVGMANGMHHLYKKLKKGQLSTLDVAQFSASLLLFCHATVNFQTARSIIEKSQNSVIQDFENSLGNKWKRMAFRTAVKCSTKLCGSSGGKSLVIRSIRRINSVDDYFTALCPENEILSPQVPIIVMLNRIGQRFGLNYVDMLLSAYEKFELSEILRRFTEPFQEMIMKLCDYLFHSMNRAKGFDFLYIAHFITEFVHHLITLVFKGERNFVLSLLARGIRPIPSSEMTAPEFCFAVLEEILQNPSSILVLYKHVQSFFLILLDRSRVFASDCCKVDFIQLFSACGILLKTDKPHWEIIIDFAKQIFDSLNLRKFSSLVQILKEVCLYVQKKVLDMQRRYDSFRNRDNDSQMEVNDAMNLLFEDVERESFARSIQEQNLDTISEEIIHNEREQAVYTEENPLILRKCFLIREQYLLSQEEIVDICKKTLRLDNLPSEFCIMQHNLQTFVRSGNTVVVITCDLENDRTLSFARSLPSDSLQNTSELGE